MTKYYEKKIPQSVLELGFDSIAHLKEIDIKETVDFSEFNDYFNTVKDDESVTVHDFIFSQLIYKAISNSKLDNKYTFDLRFWQWVCLNEIKEYCLWRWKINADSPKKLDRFLGSGGVTGFSKNSASRLYFPAKGLLVENGGESLLEDFWSLTQKELSISQSTLSINPKIFLALVKATKGLNTGDTNKAIVKLNLLKSNLFLDIMDESEILDLIT
jgi:hypothetical protein